MNKVKNRVLHLLALTANAIAVFYGGVGIYKLFMEPTNTLFSSVDLISNFRWFTNVSVILAVFVCALCIPFNLACVISGKSRFPKFVGELKLVASALILTNIAVVVFILGKQMTMREALFEGNMLVFHVILPILLPASLILFESTSSYKFSSIFLGPTILTIYFAYIYLNEFMLHDSTFAPWQFMRFFEEGLYTVYYTVGILIGSFVIGLLLYIANKIGYHTVGKR